MADPYDRIWKRYHEILLQTMDNHVLSNPYHLEIRKLQAIQTGMVEELEAIQKENTNQQLGKLSADPIRNEIDTGIEIVTLSRHAAAMGGLSPETCFSLGNATIQEMESCRDVAMIKYLYTTTEMRYCMLVKELRERRGETEEAIPPDSDNIHITHFKHYILSHLSGKITVEQIANAIGLEANYLSALFSRKEHITLKKYILQEKINLAQNMLVHSPYTYIEIANHLGFASQSHLGEHFKRITGMTLRQYRESHEAERIQEEKNEEPKK